MTAQSVYFPSHLTLNGTEAEERRFKRIWRLTLLIFVLAGIVVPFLPAPQPERDKLERVPPRIAKLLVEKKAPPPPPPPPPKPKEPEKVEKKPEPTPEKKPEPKPEPKKVEPKPKVDSTVAAREKAKKSGLLAMQDQFADLRSERYTAKLQNSAPLKKSAAASTSTNNNPTSVIGASASKRSGGINTAALSRDTGSAATLEQRSTTKVESSIPEAAAASTQSANSARRSGRSSEEIQLVFDRNKGPIDTLYNRALRKDPTLQGKVVFEVTIGGDGQVLDVKIISSELNDAVLERKLIARIKLFNFGAKQVDTMTVKYPIYFLPS